MSSRFTVVIVPRAEAELEDAYLWMREHHGPERAIRWRKQVLAAAIKLERFPRRGAIAPDSPPDADVRAVHAGPYRVLYIIDERTVAIVHIRHGAQASGGFNLSGWRRRGSSG